MENNEFSNKSNYKFMKKPFKRPRDPRLNILSIDNPQFFLKEKHTMDEYLAASFPERHKMLDRSQKKWNEWCFIWDQIEFIINNSDGNRSAVPKVLRDQVGLKTEEEFWAK